LRKVVNFLENYYMISVEGMIASYEAHMIPCKPESFDRFDMDELIMSCSFVESYLSKTLTAKLQICFGHMKKFEAFFPVPLEFLMALVIYHDS